VAVTAGSESADLGRRGGCCGCYGTVSYSCQGCYGCHGCCGYVSSCHGCCGYVTSCHGCCGYVPTHGCCGYVPTHGCCGTVIYSVPVKTVAVVSPNVATVVVKLPADARLTIDGEGTTSTSTERTFESPALEAGKVYSYTLEASYLKDGKTVTVSKKIKIEAGKVSNVDLLDTATTNGVARN
jgi:uncharacterized protein (TIGR03000 family)